MDELELTLNNPLTDDDWDKIADVDFDYTTEIAFRTKHGKVVKFIKERIGTWVRKSKKLDLCTEWWYECSECGNKPLNDRYGHPYLLSNYCPFCGLKMAQEDIPMEYYESGGV